MIPERLAFWEIYPETFGWARAFVLVAAVIAVAIFGYGVYRRVRLWRRGRPETGRFDQTGRRIVSLLRYGFAQTRVLRERVPGIFHGFIFFGFVVLFLGTSLTAFDEDFYRLITGEKIIQGTFYIVFSLLLDIAGVLAIAGLGIAAWRRYVTRSERLDDRREDWTFLVAILVVLATGFLTEAPRIAREMPAFEALASPFGYLLALPLSGLGDSANRAVHAVFWFGHLIAALAFIAWLPFSKGLHILTGWFNVYTADLGPKGKLPAIPDMMARMEAGEDVELGYKNAADLTWKDRLMLDACTRCGRCQEACPAYATGKDLNPKQVIQDLRTRMLTSSDGNGCLLAAECPDTQAAVASNVLWACTNCMACMNACPVLIEHLPLVVQMRRELAMEFDDMGQECRLFFKNMDTNANPWGMSPADRPQWSEGIDVPTVFDNPDFEYILWVGCVGAYDQRSQKIARATATILNAAGVNYATLGEMEICCGDPVRRLGNEASFQAIVQMTRDNLKEAGIEVNKVITICPHCFNTLAKDYKQFGLDWEVVHHSTFIADLIRLGRIRPNRDAGEGSVAYHDSCFLGRYNDIYDAPREIVRASGLNPVEAEQSGDGGFCCGGGGGRAWLEEEAETVEHKINVARVTQLAATGARTLVTACPYCMMMFEEGTKLKKVRRGDDLWSRYNADEQDAAGEGEVDLSQLVDLKDIAEIVAERLPGR